jgi:hypothetical protein
MAKSGDPMNDDGSMDGAQKYRLLHHEFRKRGISPGATGYHALRDPAAYTVSRPWGVFLETPNLTAGGNGATEEEAIHQALDCIPVP